MFELFLAASLAAPPTIGENSLAYSQGVEAVYAAPNSVSWSRACEVEAATSATEPYSAALSGGWKLAGICRCEEEADRMADKLERQGYETCVKPKNGHWCVYCRK